MGGGRRRICALAAALTVWAVAAPAEPSPDFAAWASGDWVDPRLHRCGEIHVRIRVDGALLSFDTVTFGSAVPGAAAEILSLEPDGSAILFNMLINREQRLRYVTPDAMVLERRDGSGGVTFVRCRAGTDVPSN